MILVFLLSLCNQFLGLRVGLWGFLVVVGGVFLYYQALLDKMCTRCFF